MYRETPYSRVRTQAFAFTASKLTGAVASHKMASTILFVLFVSLLLGAALSLPISQDKKSVESDSAQNVELSGRTHVFDIETKLRRYENIKQVKSLESVPLDAGVKRTKREVIVNHSCAEDMVWFVYRCVTREKYERLSEEDEE